MDLIQAYPRTWLISILDKFYLCVNHLVLMIVKKYFLHFGRNNNRHNGTYHGKITLSMIITIFFGIMAVFLT